MRESLQPLKVFGNHTTSVQIDIRYDENVACRQDILSPRCNWTVCTLTDNLRPNGTSIVACNLVSGRSRNQNVTIHLETTMKFISSLAIKLSIIVQNGTSLLASILELQWIETILTVDKAITLQHTNDLGTVSSQRLGRTIAHRTDTLDDHTLTLDSGLETNLFRDLGTAEGLTQTEEHTKTNRPPDTTDTSVVERFAGGHTVGVEIMGSEGTVGVCDPGHLTLVCAQIGGDHIHTGADVVFLRQFHGVGASQRFQLVDGVLVRIHHYTTESTSKRNIHDRTFESVQSGKATNVILTDERRKTDSTMARPAMVAVMTSVGLNLFNATIGTLEWEAKREAGVAELDLTENRCRMRGVLCRRVKVVRNTVDERVLVGQRVRALLTQTTRVRCG
mmetsp:Transcript_38941/g.98187  ORF Transcript_38941/g.98187 Transcript_38941/m.98187 type:complete len:391 (-) Transcript_38941:1445-2617(-)